MANYLAVNSTGSCSTTARIPEFREKLALLGIKLRAATVDTLQVNVGKLCNQACKHCTWMQVRSEQKL